MLATSPWIPSAPAPILATASSTAFLRLPVMMTWAPSVAKRLAAAKPMPLLPPVISATFPVRVFIAFAPVRERFRPHPVIVRGAHLMEPAEEETGGSGTHRVDLRAPIAVRHRPRVAGTRIDAAGSTQRTTPSAYRPCMAARSVGPRVRSHLGSPSRHHLPQHRTPDMTSIITKDGTEIFYKDMGRGQPIVFHHGWPLCSDDWDAQMLFFLEQGYRVIAHDRRGHGRSSQSANGNNMDTYAADVAA